jgi:mannitol-1-phosphate 5-dehydrogenase
MVESAIALSVRYGQPSTPLLEELDDLLHRFGNRALGDTVERVGRDPERKMAAGDRLLGAYAAAVEQHVPTRHLSLAVAAGADALRRHEGWSPSKIDNHLRSALGADLLTHVEWDLLRAQIAEFTKGLDLTRQVNLIDATYETPPAL